MCLLHPEYLSFFNWWFSFTHLGFVIFTGIFIELVKIEEFFDRGIEDVMAEAREIVGEKETYISYDIDFIDPAFAPGTGTPEVGGPNSYEALKVVRELAGVKIVGADMVEVSPPFDPSSNTAFLGVSVMFELLCQMVN